MALGTEVGLSPGNFVLDGDPAPSQKGTGDHPQFSVHFYCGQTAGWIKMALCMGVGLGPGHIALHCVSENGYHPSTNDNINDGCPTPFVFGTNIAE